jgi:hypothetical protein
MTGFDEVREKSRVPSAVRHFVRQFSVLETRQTTSAPRSMNETSASALSFY